MKCKTGNHLLLAVALAATPVIGQLSGGLPLVGHWMLQQWGGMPFLPQAGTVSSRGEISVGSLTMSDRKAPGLGEGQVFPEISINSTRRI